MKTIILKGKELSETILDNLYTQKESLPVTPGLAVILIGDDKSSKVYVKIKEKTAQQLKVNFFKYIFEADASEKEILEAIDFLNKDEETHGILVQLPLPIHLNKETIINAIDPKKDVDGFHKNNHQLLMTGKPYLIPGLNLAIMELLKSSQEPLLGKTACVICNSPIFGESVNKSLEDLGITGQTCSAEQYALAKNLQNSDIIIIAIGQANWLKANMIKEGATVIDVGINKLPNGQLAGDADAQDLQGKAAYLSPVPGGVGPLTVAMLMENLYTLTIKSQAKS
jgi:methylenetetrahydrofolate dehydrogenase (NADP+)/methenyltetrahydrofolate cyclohydrolase